MTNNNPFVKFLFAQMYHEGITTLELSKRTGICRDTIKGWRTKSTPRLMDMEAALNAIGFELKIGVREQKKPPVNNGVQLRLVKGGVE